MLQETSAKETRKRKRPRVPLEQRQRAPIACASCRRLKEKCDGSIPCQRCERYKRECFAVPQSGNPETQPPLPDERDPSNERVQDLEFIARHYLGESQLSDEDLRRIVSNLETETGNSNDQPRSQEEDELTLDQERFTVKALSHSVAHYSGELSHWNFSQRVRAQADKRLKIAAPTRMQSQPDIAIVEYWRAHHLQSRSTAFRKLRASLPPKHVALFLAKVYFQHAQTNTFFVEEAWLYMKIDAIYGTEEELCSDDAAWLCTTLGVLAVGTEFVHMEESPARPSPSETNNGDAAAAAVAAGVSFYKLAAELIPDVITIASVESVQAFLALAHYALPLDAQGLAYTFLGLALKMAIQNGMHRKYSGDLSPELVDLRNRLWWTAYRLEKRVSILHGRPASISSSEIDAEYPSDALPGTTGRVLENAMTKITDWLGDIAVIVHMLRRSPKRLRRAYFERMMQVRRQYLQWWQGANIDAPTMSSRAVAHIHMSHHLNIIFLGRPFMFQTQRPTVTADTTGVQSYRGQITELVQDAINSAVQIVNTASQLQLGAGLARSSYMEFSSCRAAMLVLLAQCLNGPDETLRAKLTEGMHLIKLMAPANASTESEASLMTAIEAAVRQLDTREEAMVSNDDPGEQDNLSSFMRWATGFQKHDNHGPPALTTDDGTSAASARVCEINETFAENGWSPFDMSILDGESGASASLDSHHFEDAFSIANAGESELFGDLSTWQ